MAEITEKRETINIDHYDIAAGDLANEIGKKLMRDLEESIEKHAVLRKEKLWFLTSIRKNPANTREIHMFIHPSFVELKIKREQMDLWEYDYLKNKLSVVWSVPHRTEMKNFLRSPEKYNKDLIKWITEYLDQEKINLNDSSAQVIH